MTRFLQSTNIIDWQTPAVLERAKELTGGVVDDESIVRQCFVWVRDEIRHSSDFLLPVVTCKASDVLRERAGYCFAKSHLLAALLRANSIPAALCYQRLRLDEAGTRFCLHGLNAVFLQRHGWYRLDPRGNKPGITTDFCPPVEQLAFTPHSSGEFDLPQRFAEPLPEVVEILSRAQTADEVAVNLPDYRNKLADSV